VGGKSLLLAWGAVPVLRYPRNTGTAKDSLMYYPHGDFGFSLPLRVCHFLFDELFQRGFLLRSVVFKQFIAAFPCAD
jgi:hypothetical protein